MKKDFNTNDNVIVSEHVREAFNKILVNIDYAAVDKKVKSILITGSMMAEGKSTVAANVAISMAVAGRKTLLLDADMRQPRLHVLFSTINTRGLSDIIVHDDHWTKYILDTGMDNLNLITSGRKPPNPSELLGSQRMHALMMELKEHYDYIIVDAPPILPVPDALTMSKNVDGMILIVRHGFSNLNALEQARDSLKLINAPLIGAIINDVPSDDYNYGYGYGYGYGYNYGGNANNNTNVEVSKNTYRSKQKTASRRYNTRRNS